MTSLPQLSKTGNAIGLAVNALAVYWLYKHNHKIWMILPAFNASYFIGKLMEQI